LAVKTNAVKYPSSSHYETVAQAFQVLDIATPLNVALPPSAGLETVRDAIGEAMVFDPGQEFCLIRERRKIYGYFAFNDEALFEEPLEGVAKDHLTHITPNQIVPGFTYLLDAIPLFQQHFSFLS
jgi:hypothetical protein